MIYIDKQQIVWSKKVTKKLFNFKEKIFKGDASTIFLLGFFLIILIGAFLLMLPISSATGTFTDFITALFTSTSAVCVTGLVVVDTVSHWSFFGKFVIMLLIQVGGIGFMSLVTIFSLIICKKITLKERLIIQQSFNQDGLEGLVVMVKNVIKVTFLVEGIAAVILSVKFLTTDLYDFGVLQSIWLGIFHSISAFCNAGFAILPGESLVPFKNDIVVNIVVMILIIIGGLGVTVWQDVIKSFKKKNKGKTIKQRFNQMTLHSKIAIMSTLVLLFAGYVIFLILEFNNVGTIGQETFFNKNLEAMFYSVTLRTAGFNTFSLAALTPASKFLSLFFMIIGGSPGGTAGGLKTVTSFTIFLIVLNTIRGNEQTIIFKRKIPSSLFSKALTIVIVYILAFILATTLLLIAMPETNALDLCYEVASALGTVGVTTNVTMTLNIFGRFVIMVCMFIGRLGPITIAMALLSKSVDNVNVLEYPEENVMIG